MYASHVYKQVSLVRQLLANAIKSLRIPKPQHLYDEYQSCGFSIYAAKYYLHIKNYFSRLI